MQKELGGHISRNHWKVSRRHDHRFTLVIKSICSFKRKQTPSSEIIKHKSRPCAHGGMERLGKSWFETYAPVVNWFSAWFLMAIAMYIDLQTQSIDFTMANPQAELKRKVFIETPWGFELDASENKSLCCLKLLHNLCVLKIGGCE